jgi:methyl-accepting chemotaxis protein/cytochrome b561
MIGERYARPLRWIHWSIAGIVLAQLALAVVLTQLRSLAFGQWVLVLHQQLGLAALALVLTRMVVARRHAAPAPQGGLPRWQMRAAHLTHRAFLVLLFVQPLLGIGVAWNRGEVIRPLGLFALNSPVEFPEWTQAWFMSGHMIVAALLAALVAMHLGAVAFNRIRRGVSVLERMLPPRAENRLRNRMPIAAQLAAAFGLVLFVALCASAYSVHRYRDVTAQDASLQAGDARAMEALLAAQVSWKDWLLHRSQPASADQTLGELSGAAISALEEAGSLATTRPAKDIIAPLLNHMRQVVAEASVASITEADQQLQEAVSLQSVALFQLRTEKDELSARGHDLLVVAMLPMLLVGLGIALALARSMVGSIDCMRELVNHVREGRLDASVQVSGRGEFSLLMGEMLGMSRVLQDRATQEAERQRERDLEHVNQVQQLREREMAALAEAQLKEEQERARQAALLLEQQEREAGMRLEQAGRDRIERERQRRELAADFQLQVAGIAEGLEETVTELQNTAIEMAQLAADSATRSLEAERMAQATNATATEVAQGAGGLSTSANRMRDQAATSREGAMMAVKESSEAGNAIRGLADATAQIGQIVELIADVARQTTLLSINARVEAARAGEAGKGFAVVASEVNELATRTRQAISDIDAQIHQVGAAAQTSMSFLQRIGTRIEDLGESAGSILRCAEDQRQATEGITDRIEAMKRSTGSVVEGVRSAKGTAGETQQMADAVLAAAERMQSQTRSMQEQVARFVLEIGTVRHASEERTVEKRRAAG